MFDDFALMPQITKIAVAGNSGVTPTGAMQFKGDWPGLFVRGNAARRLLHELRELTAIATQQRKKPRGWMETEHIMEIIARDVVVEGHVPELKPLQ